MKYLLISILNLIFLPLFAGDLIIKVTQPSIGSCDGMIDITVIGGYPLYDVEWRSPNGIIKHETGCVGNDGREDISGLCANTVYSLSIIDAFCGILNYSWILNECEIKIISVGAVYWPPSACGQNDGSIRVYTHQKQGGTPPFNYHLEDFLGNIYYANNGGTYTNLTEGYYYWVITDVDGCKGKYKMSLIPDEGFYLTPNIQNSCPGQSNGYIGVYALSNNADENFNYSWSNGFMQNNVPWGDQCIVNNLSQGVYCVTVTSDVTSCEMVDCYYVFENSQTPLTLTETLTMPCEGINNGKIVTLVQGGTLPYTKSWEPNIFEGFNYLGSGTYCLAVTDYCNSSINECYELKPMTINVTHSILCENEGMGDVYIADGNPPYSIEWNTGQTTSHINNLQNGSYTVTVTDQHGCIASDHFEIEYIRKIKVESLKNNSLCSAIPPSCDGQIVLAPIDNRNYTYNWTGPISPIPPDRIINNLCPGIYNVTITDEDGCHEYLSITICCCVGSQTDFPCGQTTNIVHSVDKKFPQSNSSNDGHLKLLNVSGGLGKYYYMWTGPNSFTSKSKEIYNLGIGNYCYTITDGCQSITDCIPVVSCDAKIINPHEVITRTCQNINIGKISVDPSGGESPYFYRWSTNSTLNNITNLYKGFYTLTITDNTKCEYIFIFQVDDNGIHTFPRGCLETVEKCNICRYCDGKYIDIYAQHSKVTRWSSDCRYYKTCDDTFEEIPNTSGYGNITYYWATDGSCVLIGKCDYTGEIVQSIYGTYYEDKHFEIRKKISDNPERYCFYCFDADVCEVNYFDRNLQLNKKKVKVYDDIFHPIYDIIDVWITLPGSPNFLCENYTCQVTYACSTPGEDHTFYFCSNDAYYCSQNFHDDPDLLCDYEDVANTQPIIIIDTIINGQRNIRYKLNVDPIKVGNLLEKSDDIFEYIAKKYESKVKRGNIDEFINGFKESYFNIELIDLNGKSIVRIFEIPTSFVFKEIFKLKSNIGLQGLYLIKITEPISGRIGVFKQLIL